MVDLLSMDDSKKLLMKILEITDSEDDKEGFIVYFSSLVLEDAMHELIKSLPKNRQQGAAKKWDANVGNPAALASVLNHYFTPEQQTAAMEEAASRGIAGYLSTIEGKLDAQKRRQLFKLSQQLPTTN